MPPNLKHVGVHLYVSNSTRQGQPDAQILGPTMANVLSTLIDARRDTVERTVSTCESEDVNWGEEIVFAAE
jgi:hypothetical protein